MLRVSSRLPKSQSTIYQGHTTFAVHDRRPALHIQLNQLVHPHLIRSFRQSQTNTSLLDFPLRLFYPHSSLLACSCSLKDLFTPMVLGLTQRTKPSPRHLIQAP